jgi:uncharacterized repeat protein (TIGR02543 family)
LNKFGITRTVGAVFSTALLLVGVGVSSSVAVDTTNLYFNLNASDTGSYNPATPGTWTDLSSVHRNGTIYGTPTYNSSTGALQFTGNTGMNSTNASAAYVNMGAGFNDFTSGITVEFDAHFGPGVGPWERIFDFGNGASSDNLWVGSYASTNEIAIELWKPYPTAQTGMGRCRSADPVDALAPNTFAKIVITLDGTDCHIYKNGVEVNTVVDGPSKQPYTGSSTYDVFYDDSTRLGSPFPHLPRNITRNNNYIGRSNWGSDAAFDGAIKYVRIYTAALSPTDVNNNAATYSLTYSTSGSDGGTAPAVKTGNGLVTLATNTGSLTKTGHTFAGWATSPNQTTGVTGSYNLAADVTLYPAFTPATYNITYDEHGGSAVTDGSFTHGGSLTYPTAPTKAGYTFQGWFAASSGGTARTATAVASDNASVTLHAQWSPNTYLVTFNTHGGSPVSQGSYVFGNSLILPTAPTKSGQAFQGWFTSASGGSALSAADIAANTSDVTVHAQWVSLPSQTVTWAPSNTSLLVSQGLAAPSAASTTGDGQISYAVTSAGTTGCTVNASTGAIAFSNIGVCSIRATAAETSNYLSDSEVVDFTIGSSSAVMNLSLGIYNGAAVTGAAVDYSASGLQANSVWNVQVHSVPQTLATGTFSGTLLNGNTVLPSGLEPGWHKLVFTGTQTNGDPIVKTFWFKVSDSGTLASTATTNPNSSGNNGSGDLASTGFSEAPINLALCLLLLGLVAVLLRRLSN